MKESGIIARLKKYWAERSLYGKIVDILFYLLIVLMIIPGSRKTIATAVNKIVIQRPQVFKEKTYGTLGMNDYTWKLVATDGSLIDLQEYRNKVVFLNFWATWCPPCRAEMPNIQRLYSEYHDRIAFLLVTGDEPDVVQRFMKEKGYTLPFYRLVSTTPSALQSSSLPTTYIINRQGEIVFKKTGAFRWDSKKAGRFLDELLKQPIRQPSGTSR
jgi:thiol-disulfide isomerase/thioredoxin